LIWLIEQIEVREYQFTESHHTSSAIFAQDVCLSNRLDPNIFDPCPQQIMVCEACGVEGCTTGGWFIVKRMGDHIAFVPAFDEPKKLMLSTRDLNILRPTIFSIKAHQFSFEKPSSDCAGLFRPTFHLRTSLNYQHMKR